jgi:CHASE2 domain-containing sensor protein
MIQLRIIGFIWLLVGALGLGRFSYCAIRDIRGDTFASVIESDLITVVFLALAAFAGYGVLRRRSWGRIVLGIAGILILLYTASYVLMVGPGFGTASLVEVLSLAFFTIYSQVIAFRYGRAA